MTGTVAPDLQDAVPEYPVARECPYRPPAEFGPLRARGPVSRMRLAGGRVAWVVLGYAEVRSLLTDPRLSSNRQHPNFPFVVPVPAFEQLRRQQRRAERGALGATLIGADPPEHGRQRRMLIPSFTVRRMAALRPGVQRIVDERLAAMVVSGPPVDLVSAFALPVPSMVICELLGVPYSDHEFFEEQSRRRLDPENTDAFGKLHAYLDELIRAKEKEPGEGLLDDLLASRGRTGDLDRAELVSFALVLLLAGHDTTANMLALGTLALLEHPEQLAVLRADRSAAPAVVEELLRFMTIVNGAPRVATEDVEIGGQVIKAGEGVILALGAANHDVGWAERPDVFDVRRSARGHLGFGYGVHQCLGQNLARVEMEVAFWALFERFPGLRLAVPADRVTPKNGLLAGVAELPVTW